MSSKSSIRKQQIYSQVTKDIILIYQDSMESLNFNSCNSYLIKLNNNDYAIIDPGCSKRKLNITLKENNINYSNIKQVFLTHGHSDHISLLDLLRKKNNNIEVSIHELDRMYVENSTKYYNMLFDLALFEKKEEYREFIQAINYYTNPNSNYQIINSFKIVFGIWNVKNRKIDYTFKEGDVLPGNLKVIHAPGHTPGMCIFFREKDKILFSSDIHLSKIGASVSGNAGNIYMFKNSINRIIKMVENGIVKIILPGHGKNPITNNLKDHLLKFHNTLIVKENQLITIIQDHGLMNLEEITNLTFKVYLKRFEKYLTNRDFKDTIIIAKASEMMTNLNFLKELERKGKIKEVKRKDLDYWKFL